MSTSSTVIGWVVFACLYGAALVGMLLRKALPQQHLSDESKDSVKLAMGLLGTMAALVIGLLIASAKGSFDAQNNELKEASANILLLDRALAHYGPETKDIRETIRRLVAQRLKLTWPEDPSRTSVDVGNTTPSAEGMEEGIRHLSPQTDAQRELRAQALQIVGDVLHTRWLVFGGMGNSIQTPFLVVLVFWLTVIFGIYGLFAPRNGTVIAILLVCALSMAGSIFLILEMDQPFEGILKVSSAPLQFTLSHLGE